MRRSWSLATRSSRLIRGLGLAVLLAPLAATAAEPQSAPARPQAPGGPANIARIDEGGRGQAINLTTTKARQITMPVDVRDVVVADPTVADVLIKTPRLVYLIGSKVGDTNAIFLDAAGHQAPSRW